MNEQEKSDPAIVAMKPANKTGKPAAEWVEPRAGTKGNADHDVSPRTQSREKVTHDVVRIRQAAQREKASPLTSLLHHINQDSLSVAFYALKRDASAGVDGVTWSDYESDLMVRLKDLQARIHRGAYHPLPTRRGYIPKADGTRRPLAVTALEDKIVQRAVTTVLNAIFEEEFLGFSYGFRPGRSQHDALDALVVGIGRKRVNWILDADIRSFFDSVSQEWLIRFVEHRVGDPRIVRLIQKWLKAGVLEDGTVSVSEKGTGQGSVISPLLANIYLHYVIDLWAEQWRKREAKGDMIIVRYADDLVLGFEHEAEARRFLDAMHDRLGKFALTLHPDKTRLVEFGRFAEANRRRQGLGKPETFAFLGFTFICAKSANGRFLIKRKSRRDRLRKKLQDVKEDLRRRWHQSVPEQGKWLGQVVRGFFNYHAVPTNFEALRMFHYQVMRHWRRALLGRGNRDKTTWTRIMKIAHDYLPKPAITHPWPEQRFAVKYPR
jgi:RNA-directed DNA polymerase